MTRFRTLPPTRVMRGFTLLELTLALPLAALVVLTATAFFVAGLRAWRVQTEWHDMRERAVFAISQLKRAVRMAGYRNWDAGEGHAGAPASGQRAWTSLRASAACADEIEACKPGRYGSALLETRHHGAGIERLAGAVQSCAGRRALGPFGELDVIRNQYYVARNDEGVPSLFCRYLDSEKRKAKHGPPAQVLVAGVEAMYLRLGYLGPDGKLQWRDPDTATRRHAVQPPAGRPWEQVAAVAFALVMRGGAKAGGNARANQIVKVFDATSGGFRWAVIERAGAHRLHVFHAVALRRNDGGIGQEAAWLASSS